ncbi:M48 family metallopeptidase [Thiomicrorhabdus sediminis]|uniref:M48 family metallopeptidase n=1 Tax=Thiomicrorhabdus sediminis TaxID=2580412 RepID=UPI00143D3D1C|nr:SprT family zinc-dependent metalloprotease [Thiomicrorhabdus sediminis]
MPAKPEVVELGDYRFYLKRQKRKSIALKSERDALILHIPKQLNARQVSGLLDSHQAWLLKHAQRLQNSIEQEFRAVENSRFHFLGQLCELVYVSKDHADQAARLQPLTPSPNRNPVQFQLQVAVDADSCPLKQEQQAADCLKQWFIEQANSYLLEQLERYAEQMSLDYKTLQVKTYKGRWGSCYRDGRIQFNWRLLQAPKWVVNYVVVHELAHRRHPNHSKDFWQLVEQFYPLTKDAKLSLKQQGAGWINFLQAYQ